MKTTFKCYSCNHVFEAEGKKKEYNDPIYGPCSKMIATCPHCQKEAGEYAPKLGKSKTQSNMPPCGISGGCSCCG